MKNDDFGNRMKEYEAHETKRRFLPLLPVLARLDGRAFHSWTADLNRPYGQRFIDLMATVTRYLVQETNAVVGYTASDEISLAFYSDNPKSQIFFDGKIFKMTSMLASLCTAKFNQSTSEFFRTPRPVGHFDCRVWQVPNKTEAANSLLWREQDATRNSILSAGYAHFSHKSMHGLNTAQVQDKLMIEKGVNWNDYPAYFKRGMWFQRRKLKRKFTPDELANLPPKHTARKDPNLVVERTDILPLDMPPFGSVTNREGVVFDGKTPSLA
jgi:tRNA(His) 5'-end guanylyltransferase